MEEAAHNNSNNNNNGVGSMLFSEEEVGDISGLKRGDDYVELTCGCTSHRYGDAVGRLRVFSSGFLEISCECTPGCQEGLSFNLLYLFLSSLYKYYLYRSVCFLNACAGVFCVRKFCGRDLVYHRFT